MKSMLITLAIAAMLCTALATLTALVFFSHHLMKKPATTHLERLTA